MKTLILNNKNWQLGSSDSNEADFEGTPGLSPDYKGQNYYKSRGAALAGGPTITETTGDTLTANIIAGLADAYGSRDSILLSGDGKLYTTYQGSLTLQDNDPAFTNRYVYGISDFKKFKGTYFITSTVDVISFTDPAGAIDWYWWVNTMGKTALTNNIPHPMESVEDTLYIANGNKINTWDGTTAVDNQFSLPSGYVITAMRVHPDGRYLKVFATMFFELLHGSISPSRMFLFDTVSLEFINTYDFDDQIDGAQNSGGTCFLTYGDNFGYFDGYGAKLIRKIDRLSGGYPIYSPILSNFNNTLLFPSFRHLNAYGDVNGKGNIFFYPSDLGSPIFVYFAIPLSSGKCLIQYTLAGAFKLVVADLATFANLTAQTTKIDVGARIWIRKLDIYCDSLPTNASLTFYNRQADGTLVTIGTLTRAGDGAITKKQIFCNVLTDFVQLYVSGTSAPMIKQIHLQYESAE